MVSRNDYFRRNFVFVPEAKETWIEEGEVQKNFY